MNIKLERAKRLIDAGYSIIPIKENKRPAVKWKENQTKAYSKNEIDNLQGKIPINGYGFVTGYDNVEVIDVDLKVIDSAKKQKEFWDEFISMVNDSIPNLLDKVAIYKTVNNGYHLIYKASNLEGNQKLAKLKGMTEAIIETRGKKGYAFIYDNKVGKIDYTEITEISEKERDTIISICKYFDYKEEKENYSDLIPEQRFHSETPCWEDFNNRNSALDVVRDDFEIIKELSDKYIIRRYGATSDHSGYVYKDSQCMYLFSTGTLYPSEILLSPFACYTYKHHGGDWSLAAKELYQKGYGDRIVVTPCAPNISYDKENVDFPIEIFPEQMQNYIYQCYETLDSSIDYMACSLLWSTSLIIGNTIRIEVKKGWTSPATIWIALIGRAGVGKTPSISNVIFPLEKQNTLEIKHYMKEYDKYQEYKSKDKNEQEYVEKVDKPKYNQLLVNDITIEALVEMHEHNKHSIGIFKDELAGWFKDMNKYRAGSDLEFWLSSWSGKSVVVNRKTSKNSFVEKPMIPVIGGIQPEILDQFYQGENKDNGFIDRILFAYPDLDIEMYNDNEMDEGLLEWWESAIINLYKTVRKDFLRYNTEDEVEPHIAYLTNEAKVEWKRIFNEITTMQNSDTENQYMKSMLPKQKTYIPRFALLINFINAEGDVLSISKDSMLKAEKLSKYFINMAKKIKVHSTERMTAKDIIERNKMKSNEEKAQIIIKNNPEMSKSEIANILNVSRQMVYKYLK